MSPGDAPLVVALVDALIEARVGDLYSIACDPNEPMVAQWSRLIGVLRTAGYEIVKSGAPSEAADPGILYRRLQPKLEALLRRVAPKGTKVTPELTAHVRVEILSLVTDELREAGLPAQAIEALAHMFAAAITVKPKT